MQNDKSKITEMFSAQGEKVEMEHPVEAKGKLFRIFHSTLPKFPYNIQAAHQLHVNVLTWLDAR